MAILDLNKAIVTIDNSKETLDKFDKRVRYSNATPQERRALAEQEVSEWNVNELQKFFSDSDNETE
ncbi:MAG: hypothetical protein IJO91_03710 [Oscillospiraceae bacterium]|nr:hypothetical protein [Oscillospiraceae bacterium]